MLICGMLNRSSVCSILRLMRGKRFCMLVRRQGMRCVSTWNVGRVGYDVEFA